MRVTTICQVAPHTISLINLHKWQATFYTPLSQIVQECRTQDTATPQDDSPRPWPSSRPTARK
jgi:hypothetical protein